MKKGFTLVELLVVMAIMGILVILVAGGFRTSQMRGRDAQRKSDLKQIATALEAFINDYGVYPAASSGRILACPYSTGVCAWGTGEFTDGKTVYFREIPADPSSKQYYRYRLVPASSSQKFQLFAKLENTQDKDIISTTYNCGTGPNSCDYAVTSSNTTAND